MLEQYVWEIIDRKKIIINIIKINNRPCWQKRALQHPFCGQKGSYSTHPIIKRECSALLRPVGGTKGISLPIENWKRSSGYYRKEKRTLTSALSIADIIGEFVFLLFDSVIKNLSARRIENTSYAREVSSSCKC